MTQTDQQVEPAEQKPSYAARRLKWLLGLIAILIAGWSAAWYYIADRIDIEVTKFIEVSAENGNQINCNGQDLRGFPFRMGLFCPQGASFKNQQGQGVETAAIRTASQVYDIGKMIIEADGPAKVQLTDDGTLSSNWNSLRASIRQGQKFPKQFSLTTSDFGLTNTTGEMVGSLQSGEFHARPSPKNADDLDLYLKLADVKLPDHGNIKIPTFAGDVDLTFNAITNQLINEGFTAELFRQDGASGTLHRFELRPKEGGIIRLSGPWTANPDGLLSGTFELAIADFDRMFAIAKNLFPGITASEGTVKTVFNSLGSQIELYGKPARSVSLNANNGNLKMGLIPLGRIPALF